mgnify:FL=1
MVRFIKEDYAYFIMDNDIGIVIGTGIGGQKSIVETLRDSGFQVSTTGKMWPRDHYVYFNGKYIKSDSPGSIDGNAFGEGGNILTGEGFLLVSDMAYLHQHVSENLPDNPSYEQIRKAIIAEGEKHNLRARIHVAPTGYFHGRKGHSHIDMFSLLLPKQKLLLLDTHYGKGAGSAKEYEAITEEEGLRLIKYDGSQDGIWYPLNSLVLSTDRGETVAVDGKAKSLVNLLESEGIESICVDMPQHSYPAGKIRCQTNTYNLKDKPEDYMRND